MTRGQGRQATPDLVEQLVDAVAMLRRDFEHRFDPEPVEFVDARTRGLVVGLVDRQKHRYVELADPSSDLFVARYDSFAAIDEHDDNVRRLESPKSLFHDERVEWIG